MKQQLVDRVPEAHQHSPPLFAGASLKLASSTLTVVGGGDSPPLFAGASLKLRLVDQRRERQDLFPPAFCGGLIEAPG